MTDPRNTQEWKRLRRRVVAEEPVCWLQLPGCTTVSTVADHVKPVSTHPELALIRSNVRGACESCNKKRGGFPADRMVATSGKAWRCSACGQAWERPALLIFCCRDGEAVPNTYA